VSEIGDQTIGDIDHRVRDSSQSAAKAETRIGHLEACD